MMRNKAGGGMLAPQSPRNEPRIWHFPPNNLKIWVNSCESHTIIQTATERPFTKGTRYLVPIERLRVAVEIHSCGGEHRGASIGVMGTSSGALEGIRKRTKDGPPLALLNKTSTI